jgi:hypothetical protein
MAAESSMNGEATRQVRSGRNQRGEPRSRHVYEVRIEYYEDIRSAIAKFIWAFPRFTERISEEASTPLNRLTP